MDATHALAPRCAYCAKVEAPRRRHPTTFPALEAILLSTILGTLCGAQHWVESEPWGQAQQAWLSECRALPHGIPSHDTCGRILALLDPASLPQTVVAWMRALVARCPASLARDGKAMRRSRDHADGKGPRHGGSAWASHKELGLAQGTVEATSNAITTLPALLALRNLEGTVVTIDAMGGQGALARQSIDPGGAYGRRLKATPPNVSEDGGEVLAWLKGPQPLAEEIVLGTDVQGDGGHGRGEPRHVWCPPALEGGGASERWPGVPSLGMVASPRSIGGQDEVDHGSSRSALPGATDAEAQRVPSVMRTHWESDNRGHWVVDGAMAEDTNHPRKGERAQNLALIRKLALTLLRKEPAVKTGFAAKQQRAGWDRNYLLTILAQT